MYQVFSHLADSDQGTIEACNHTQRRAGLPLEGSSMQYASYENPPDA